MLVPAERKFSETSSDSLTAVIVESERVDVHAL